MISLICGIQNNITIIPLYKREIEPQMYSKKLWVPRGKRREINWEIGIDI